MVAEISNNLSYSFCVAVLNVKGYIKIKFVPTFKCWLILLAKEIGVE